MQNLQFLGFADPISSWIHLLTAGVSLVGAFYLIRKGRGHGGRVFSLSIYSFALVYLFSMSGVFHLLEYGGTARAVLQRLDHSGIWVLIAGSMTPIHGILFRGPLRWLVLTVVWIVAITGLVLEVVFFRDFPEWLALVLYLSLGWIGVVGTYTFNKLYRPHSCKLIVLGGLLYSVGAIIDFVRWPVIWSGVVGPHEIFHIAVTAAAICHWIFIYRWADHPVSDSITCDVFSYSTGQHRIDARNDHFKIAGENIDVLKEHTMKHFENLIRHKRGFEVLFRYFQYEHKNGRVKN